MSSRTWLLYFYQNRFYLTPLSYEALEYASGFASEQCPEGIVVISANTLRFASGDVAPKRWFSILTCSFFTYRILALEKLGVVLNQVSHQLQYTPRKFIVHPETNNIISIESDHNTYTDNVKQMRKQQMAEVRELCQ